MAYDAKILADSLSPDGVRLTTFEVTIPRIVLAEFNTHRMLSRNSASSRAIPVAKSIDMVEDDPFIPETFVANQKGMQGDTELDEAELAEAIWREACESAVRYANSLEGVNLHKALANRILEPFKWQTIIVTATEWSNFFALRTDSNAQAEIRKPAQMMKTLYEIHEPRSLEYGDWHLPLVSSLDWMTDLGDWDFWKKVSVGRCARVSYLTHDGVRDPEKDVALHDMLMKNGHLSPFEHVATPVIQVWKDTPAEKTWSGNFRGWDQYRKQIPNENDFSLVQNG